VGFLLCGGFKKKKKKTKKKRTKKTETKNNLIDI
jgi:hypothetical protein